MEECEHCVLAVVFRCRASAEKVPISFFFFFFLVILQLAWRLQFALLPLSDQDVSQLFRNPVAENYKLMQAMR